MTEARDGSSTATVLVAVDARTPDVSGAEHLVHRLEQALAEVERDDYVASTHVVHIGGAHTAVAASWSLVRSGESAPALVELVSRELGEAGAVVRIAHGSEFSAGPTGLLDGARAAAVEHRERSAGRLVLFPGKDAIQRRLRAADVVRLSCVDAVEALAGIDVGPDSLLDLTDFVRPTWHAGRCVVLVQPAAGALVPFEVRHQIACCADH